MSCTLLRLTCHAVVCLVVSSSARAADATVLTAHESPAGTFTVFVDTNAVFDAIEIGVSGDVSQGQNAVAFNADFQSRQIVSTTDGPRLLSPLGPIEAEGVFQPGLNQDIDLTYGVTTPVGGTWIDGLAAEAFLRFDVGPEAALAEARVFRLGQVIATAALRITPGRLVGDFNEDGSVDAADYTVWRAANGDLGTSHADGNGDGVVGPEDYSVWAASYGRPQKAAALPTPNAGLSLLMLCALSAGRPPRNRDRAGSST